MSSPCLHAKHEKVTTSKHQASELPPYAIAPSFREISSLVSVEEVIIWAIVMVLATLLGIVGVKSLTETLLFQVPIVTRMAKNVYAFVGDAVTLVISIPVILLVEMVRERK